MYDPDSLEFARVRDLWDAWASKQAKFIAPSLLRYEVTNAVYRPVRLGRAPAAEALSVIRSLEQLPIRYFDTVDLNVAAFEIARMLQLDAAYDAHYLALARQENAVLYTADKRLGLAASARFPFVRYVMDEN